MDSINKLIQIRLDIYIYITYICKLYIYRTRAPVRAICFLSVFQEQLVENTCLKHGNGQQISNP